MISTLPFAGFRHRQYPCFSSNEWCTKNRLLIGDLNLRPLSHDCCLTAEPWLLAPLELIFNQFQRVPFLPPGPIGYAEQVIQGWQDGFAQWNNQHNIQLVFWCLPGCEFATLRHESSALTTIPWLLGPTLGLKIQGREPWCFFPNILCRGSVMCLKNSKGVPYFWGFYHIFKYWGSSFPPTVPPITPYVYLW